jgi:hypothetical protein
MEVPRIRMARRAALVELLMPTVATGMPRCKGVSAVRDG